MIIGSIHGAVKRAPSVLKKYFLPDDFYFAQSIDDAKLNEVDVFVQTNLMKHKFYIRGRSPQYEYIIKSNKPKLVLESPMFRSISMPDGTKNGLHRMGWNSYQYADADFNNTNSPSDRWHWMQKTYKIARRDWKANGEHILLLLQKPGDSSLNKIYVNQGYKSYWKWAEDQVKEIRKYTDRKIIIRPHINQQSAGYKHAKDISSRYDNCFVSENYKWHESYGGSGGEALQKDLSNAWCSVIYNSLSGVESVMSGTPVIALDQGAMCWPVAHHKMSEIENLKRDISIDQWLYDCAYTTWTSTEFHSGKVWDHLKPRYEYWKNKSTLNDKNFDREMAVWKSR
jgi:hypothetical protein